MGQIVAAMATCHAPALFLRQPGEDPAQLDATVAAMRQLGRALAEVIAERPERVAILASGGMSHYPGTDKYGNPEFEFDRSALAVLERGDLSSLLSLSTEKLDEVGNTELLTWYVLFGAIGD